MPVLDYECSSSCCLISAVATDDDDMVVSAVLGSDVCRHGCFRVIVDLLMMDDLMYACACFCSAFDLQILNLWIR